MKWQNRSFLGAVLTGVFLSAACGGNDRPPETGSTQVNPSDNLQNGIDNTPLESKPPDTPPDKFEGNPGQVQEDNPQKTPAPAGSTPATGGP